MTITSIQGKKLVRLRGYPRDRLFWERETSIGGRVLVIPVVDDLLKVTEFFHVQASDIIRDGDEAKQPGFGQDNIIGYRAAE